VQTIIYQISKKKIKILLIINTHETTLVINNGKCVRLKMIFLSYFSTAQILINFIFISSLTRSLSIISILKSSLTVYFLRLRLNYLMSHMFHDYKNEYSL